MTALMIGLGPIGANVADRMLERGHEVLALELDADRANAWATESGGRAVSDAASVPWADVDVALVAVRVASQLESVVAMLTAEARADIAVIVLTTLSPSDAARILGAAPSTWRTLEAPLSGGPQGARAGTMTLMLAGPRPNERERTLLADIAGKQVWTDAYGKPAMLKLTNNTLGACNALATATMLEIAADHGIDPAQFLDVVSTSSGQSWMSDNFDNFHYPLLFKDAGLLIDDVGAVPSITLGDQPAHIATIEHARRRAFGDDAVPRGETA